MLLQFPASLSRLIVSLCLAATLSIDAFAQRELTDIPEPDPVAERSQMRVDEAAAVNLYAADPDISKPIQINFDSAGGLWVASSEVYPQIAPGEIANDKIIVLRDTDGDGVADKRTVFADGLLIPTACSAGWAGCCLRRRKHSVAVPGRHRWRRRRRQAASGLQRVWHRGHASSGPHAALGSRRLPLFQPIDLHSQPHRNAVTERDTWMVVASGGIVPSTGRLEVFCKGFVNPWGHVFDPVGESFVTDGAFFEGINYVFPDSVFVTSPGATRWLKGLNPGSPKHCGVEILSGTHVPPEWSGDLVDQ